MRTPFLALMLLLGATASPLFADTFESFAFNFCTPGSFKACASVSVTVTQTSNGHTRLVMYLQNMQGTDPADNTGGSSISSFHIRFPNDPNRQWFTGCTNCVQPGKGPSGPVMLYGGGYPGIDQTFLDGPPESGVDLYFNSDSHLGFGFFGCDPGPFPKQDGIPTTNGIGTCPRDGLGGYFVWGLETDDQFVMEDLTFSIGFSGVDGRSTGCAFNPDKSGTCEASATVVPEPETWVLLGTGLLIMGFVARGRFS